MPFNDSFFCSFYTKDLYKRMRKYYDDGYDYEFTPEDQYDLQLMEVIESLYRNYNLNAAQLDLLASQPK